ncbi:MAG TPA: extracellular solute-binding protein [Anaerolineaceae bacterium]|nr:extracellular solute-binding protein [Anaerolineaceae bacterium]HPN54249.1 extracellular solute-binding protein [Anaerolineaceae bacterium]
MKGLKVVRLFVFLLLVISIAACSTPTAAPTAKPAEPTKAPVAAEPTKAPAAEPTAVPAAKDVTLVLGSWRVDDAEAWANILEAFHAKYPNITVKFDPTNPPDYNATLRTQLETGNAPDLFFVRSFATGRELFDAGYIASLKDLPGLSDAISAASNAPWATDKGEPYAVPIAAVSHGIYYNQDLFEKNGIAIPKTWEELMAAAEKLKAAGVTPFANGTKDAWDINEVVMMTLLPNLVGGLDGRMAYLNGERCFNDAAMVAAFQEIKDMTPYLPEGFTALTYYDSQQLFVQGKAAMMFDGSWSISGFEKDAPDFKWSVFAAPPPAGKDQYISFHMDAAIGMNAASKNPEAARTFLTWLESVEFAEMFGNEIPGFFPVSNTQPQLKDPVAAAFLSFNTQAKGTDIRFVWEKLLAAPSGQVDAYTAMNNAVIAVLKGEQDPQQAADSLQTALAGWYEPAKTCKK